MTRATLENFGEAYDSLIVANAEGENHLAPRHFYGLQDDQEMERGFASKWDASRQWPSVRDACSRTRGAPTGPWGPYGAWLTRRSQTTSGEQPRTISLLLGCRHNLLHRTLEIATTNKGLDAFLERNVVNSVSYRCNCIRLSNDLSQPSLDPTATISRGLTIVQCC